MIEASIPCLAQVGPRQYAGQRRTAQLLVQPNVKDGCIHHLILPFPDRRLFRSPIPSPCMNCIRAGSPVLSHPTRHWRYQSSRLVKRDWRRLLPESPPIPSFNRTTFEDKLCLELQNARRVIAADSTKKTRRIYRSGNFSEA